jgi:hypothetical protein
VGNEANRAKRRSTILVLERHRGAGAVLSPESGAQAVSGADISAVIKRNRNALEANIWLTIAIAKCISCRPRDAELNSSPIENPTTICANTQRRHDCEAIQAKKSE